MSMAESQQQAPAVTIAQNSFTTRSSHGSIGPLIAVLVVIMVLSIVAVTIGRLCSGRTILGYGHFDIERWAEAHCSSCIDGRISSPPPPPRPSLAPNSALPSMPPPPPPQSRRDIKNEDDDDEEEEENL